jgi:hypothetical protein
MNVSVLSQATFWPYQLHWPLAGVTQYGGRKLTCIMMVAIRNLNVEYGHFTVKQTTKIF